MSQRQDAIDGPGVSAHNDPARQITDGKASITARVVSANNSGAKQWCRGHVIAWRLTGE